MDLAIELMYIYVGGGTASEWVLNHMFKRVFETYNLDQKQQIEVFMKVTRNKKVGSGMDFINCWIDLEFPVDEEDMPCLT